MEKKRKKKEEVVLKGDLSLGILAGNILGINLGTFF